MIRGINQSGKYITISGTGGSTYISSHSNGQGISNMRYNTSTQNVEVYDGNSWLILSMGYPSIGLTSDAEHILDWAKKKQAEEVELELLAQSNPAIKDLVNQLKEKKEQIKMVITLLKSPGENGNEQELNRP